MDISLEQTSTLGRKLTVQVPSTQIDGEVDSRIRDLGRRVRLKGFRPGKVPYKVLEQRYGQQVRQEVVGEVIQQSFQNALVQEKLRPVASPQIDAEAPEPNKDLQFTASFDVFPELESMDVSGLEIERVGAEVTEADVDQMIETLREQRQSWNDVDRAAGEGDLVFFHFSASAEGVRVPEEQGEEERAGAILGNGAFDPDFEAQLIGLEAGAEKQFTIAFGDEFRDERLAGKSGEVAVRVEKVQESVKPKVDDEFFAGFGVTEGGLEAFRADVRRNMERELKTALSQKLRGAVLDRLIAHFTELEAPEAMIESESRELARSAREQMQRMGVEDPPEGDPTQFREQAERRVRGALLVSEVARHAELEVDASRVRDTVNEIASTYENPQAIANLYLSDEKLLANVQNVVLEEQAVEWVVENAKVVDTPKSFEEVMRP